MQILEITQEESIPEIVIMMSNPITMLTTSTFLIFVSVPDFFADDLKLASSCLFTPQNDLLSLLTWSNNYKLDLNFKKTSPLNFSETSVKCDHLVLFMENDIYLKNEKIHDLGVIVSPNLTWNSHVNSKIGNCYQRYAILRQNISTEN